MKTLLGPHFKPLVVTRDDIIIAAIALGFTIGFGFLTTWHAIKQTVAIYRRYGKKKVNSPYVWMIWSEIVACTVFAIICWLHLTGIIPPSFAFFFSICKYKHAMEWYMALTDIVTAWSLQVQFLLQIIINRICLLMTSKRHIWRLKLGVAALITAINISVYCIWVPARLQISERYVELNDVWDRCEKIIFLLVDGALNWLFIRTVRDSLVRQGLTKYDRLVRFNQCIVGLSLAMDCLIIGMMSLNNSFVYMQIHPLAYIVKLNIEMSMAELLAKISSSNNNTSHFIAPSSDAFLQKNLVATQLSKTFGVSKDVAWRAGSGIYSTGGEGDIVLNAKQEVSIQVERRKSLAASWKEDGGSIDDFRRGIEDDTKPLREDDKREARERAARDMMGGVERGMGVFTNIWGTPPPQDAEGVSKRNIRA